MDIAVLLAALLGHAVIWVAAINRAHACGWRRGPVLVITVACFAVMAALPATVVWRVAVAGGPAGWLRSAHCGPAMLAYVSLCVACAVAAAATRLRRCFLRPTRLMRSHRVRSVDTEAVALPSVEHPHHFVVHLPRNESLQLDLTERAIEVPRLPPSLDGLSIVHLSDLHFTGRVGRIYFEEVVRASNELEPDLLAITGDLVDRSAYIDWIPQTLGRLTARYGVYFVLGNHDRRVDVERLLRVLGDNGLRHVGGRWLEISVRGQRVVISGNELPWFSPAADLTGCPPRAAAPLRIALAHTPDQLPWARAGDADLLLAGHTHGGQIRLPLVGPIFTPSRGGVKYAAGLFYAPPTILHVSRGVSGQFPLRINCPPEMTELRLQAGRS